MNIRAQIFGGQLPAEDLLLKAKKPKRAGSGSLSGRTVQREARRSSNGRSEDRHRLADERALVTHKGRKIEVELINLSGGGAMIGGTMKPQLWDHVELHLGDHGTIECAVRWIRDGRIGLEFAHETRLDWPANEVAIVLRHVIERTFPHISFPPTEESAVLPPEEQRDDEARVARRHPLIWNGTLHHDYQSSPVRLRNISSTGAMIEIESPLRVGTEPLLELSEKVSLSVTVEWAVGDQAGVRFHSPFDLKQLAESRPAVATSEWTPPPYLSDGETQQDRWGRLSLIQLRDELEGFLRH